MSAGAGAGDAGGAGGGAPPAAAAEKKPPQKRSSRRKPQPVYSTVTEYENYGKLAPIGL